MPRHIEQCDWLIAWEQNALWCNFVWAAFKRTVYVGKNRWIGNLTLRVDDADSGDDTAHIAHVDGWRDRKNACMLIGSSKHGSVVWPLGLENYAASYQLNADMLYLVTPSTYHCRPIYERDGVKRRFVRAVFYTE